MTSPKDSRVAVSDMTTAQLAAHIAQRCMSTYDDDEPWFDVAKCKAILDTWTRQPEDA